MGTLNYRNDENLEFLKKCSDSELEVLEKILICDEEGMLRDTEDLTLQGRYQEYKGNQSYYWDLIAAEYQYYGGNTFLNWVRGSWFEKGNTFNSEGVLYEEILTDVCSKMKVNLPKNSSLETKEANLLLKVMEKTLESIPESEREGFMKDLDIKTSSYKLQACTAALQLAIRQGGFKSYQIAVIIANSISKQILGKGLTFAGNATLTKWLARFAGPIGWVITALWTAVDLAGPAYRVTIPATIYIASLRGFSSFKKCSKCKKPIGDSVKFCDECGTPNS